MHVCQHRRHLTNSIQLLYLSVVAGTPFDLHFAPDKPVLNQQFKEVSYAWSNFSIHRLTFIHIQLKRSSIRGEPSNGELRAAINDTEF